jgi:lipoate-protein ligase A
MQLDYSPYQLPDVGLIESHDNVVMVWQPVTTCLVLGQSNQIEKSLHVQAVLDDGIPVMKRNSGGETVILSPETLVISMAFDTQDFQNPSQYFRKINTSIIEVLMKVVPVVLEQKGISDISCGDKKILGSSIYRHRSRVLYHAVLNVGLPITLIERYIAHPGKEPDYRKGRSHSEFVTSLKSLGCEASVESLQALLQQRLSLIDLVF